MQAQGGAKEPGDHHARCGYGYGRAESWPILPLAAPGSAAWPFRWAVTVDDARDHFSEMICDAAQSRVVGYGLDAGVQMGPVISQASRQRIEGLIGVGASQGAAVCVDGRNTIIPGYERGAFVRPTILDNVQPGSEIALTEVFGPGAEPDARQHSG